jgi:RNA polymerase sigma-70 factor (sigma-E family)
VSVDDEGLVSARNSSAREEGVTRLFATAYEPMCRLAFVIVGDQHLAEEVVMDALLNVYRRWDHLDGGASSPDYLRRAVVNGSRSALRARGRARAKVARWASRRNGEAVDPPEPADTAVVAAVRRLPERQRACIALYYFEDLPVAEIASVVGCSEGTVKSQLAKARDSIRASLGEGS